MNNLKDYMGAVGVGDYVVYYKNGEVDLDVRKGIWKVTGSSSARKTVDLKSIANNNKFTTSVDNCLEVKILEHYNVFNNTTITEASLRKYKELIKNTINERDDQLLAYSFNMFDEDRLRNDIKESAKTSTNTTKEKEMTKMNQVIERNSDAAKTGAQIAAGKTLNTILKDQVVAQLPRKYKKLSKHALADIVIANVASFAVQNFARNNAKAQMAADAMMQAAMVDFISSFNIEKMITDVLANVDLDFED